MIEPFLKWPGGKRWLVNQHKNLFPVRIKKYFEPFLGGGAVFFSLNPKLALLSDTNQELVNVYQCIKDHAKEIDKRLIALHRKHTASHYYRVRQECPMDAVQRAVRFLYLNRTCFNGIFRVNLKGEFNVPLGSKDEVRYPAQYLEDVADELHNAEIRWCDFEESIDEACSGDFIFVDPPYTVKHNNNNFLKYNAKLFGWEDQVRLANAVTRAKKRGAMILISNADHASIRKLYEQFGTLYRANRFSVLSGTAEGRCATTELLAANYEPEDTVSLKKICK